MLLNASRPHAQWIQAQTGMLILPLGAARSALLGCSPHQTSCPGNGARSSHGFSASYLLAACGRTCTAPPVCTSGTQRHTTVRLLKGQSAQIHRHREQLALRSKTQGNEDGYIQAIRVLAGCAQQHITFPVFDHASYHLFVRKHFCAGNTQGNNAPLWLICWPQKQIQSEVNMSPLSMCVNV